MTPNYFFFKHPEEGQHERINLTPVAFVEISQNGNIHEVNFNYSLDEGSWWRFYDKESAQDVFDRIAQTYQTYNVGMVLPGIIYNRNFVDAVNMVPTEDGWTITIWCRINGITWSRSFDYTSEEQAVEVYNSLFKNQ